MEKWGQRSNWIGQEEGQAYLAWCAEQKAIQEKWRSGELYAELEREREERKRRRRDAARRIFPSITVDGKTYWSIPQLAILQRRPYPLAWSWAQRRPSLCIRYRNHLYCRNEPKSRSETIAPTVERDGKTYYSMGELGRQRGIRTESAYDWAKDHPEVTIRHEGRLYALDAPCRRRRVPAVELVEGVEYVTPRELARRHCLMPYITRLWAGRHPEYTRQLHGRVYVRADAYTPSKRPSIHWVGTTPYFRLTELARRRGVSRNAASEWAGKRPHLCLEVLGTLYVRDEEWEPKDGRETPLRVKVVPPWVKAGAARRG